MKNKEIVKMIQSGEYNHLTVGEFANMVNNHKEEIQEFDVDKWHKEAEDIIHRIFEPRNTVAEKTVTMIPDYMNAAIAEQDKKEKDGR